MKLFCYSLLTLLCAACASQPPVPVRAELKVNPDFSLVHKNIDSYIDQRVRWGGILHSIKNLTNETELEIIAKPLDSEARPQIYEPSPGRFIAHMEGFLDPSDFEAGREVTVLGTIKGTTTRTIGEYAYDYPVLRASGYYLWPKRHIVDRTLNRYYDHYPYWYDPWYGWYPWWYY